MKYRSTVSLLALVLALAACAEEEVLVNPPSAASSLPGTRWVVTGLALDGAGGALPAGALITVDFDLAGGVSGTAGCNRYFGTVTVTGSGIAVGDVGSTLMACEPEVMEREMRFLTALGRVGAFTLEADRLSLVAADGTASLDLVPFVPEPDRPLAGTVWQLTTLIEGETASSIVFGTAPTLVVDDLAEQISGNTGCNNFFGPATFGEGTVSVGALGSTKMGCEPAVMAQEALVLAVLGDAATWDIEGATLRITAADGRSLEFTAG